MNHSKIAIRYSRALFESALEKKNLDKIYNDMIFIAGACQTPEMKELLESPIIIPSRKIEILKKVLGANIEKETFALIELTVNNGRENFLPSIARAFIHDTKDYKGITDSVLTTAIKVDPKIKQQVTDFISGTFKTKAELKEVVDKEIIGGFILRIEDNYIDASIKSKLRKIEKILLGNE